MWKRVRSFRCGLFPLVLILLMCVPGCDSVARHQVISTIFDGVPALPVPEELCDLYYEQRLAAEAKGDDLGAEGALNAASLRSSHKPYVEKSCSKCHSSDKNVNDGLVAPKRDLCLTCHTGFVKGSNVHGPVAVGDCLACHLPHSSSYPSLLKEAPSEICVTCHQEKRLAEAMHKRFVTKDIGCGECHDPHSGDARYFLK